ncbi:hypothetical protein [Chitinilyticum aquatile]|uniref:hypothetical protein n=1 Tax=Chitinilyticum aquatile TaxID=362520 RepID=UPI0003F77E4F|nr:hypothetical protein [Chitinilyticum aquatile]
MQTSNWIKYWQQHALPILQESKVQLQQMLRRTDSLRPTDIEALVWNDPLLTAQVLRFINQRKRGAMASDVVAIEHIVMMMGVAPFLERCSHLPTVEQYLLPADPQAYQQLLQLLARARFSRALSLDLSTIRNDAYPEELQAAALLAVVPDMLHLLGSHLPEKAPAADRTTIGALIAAWQLPDALTQLLGGNEVPSVRVALQSSIVRLCSLLEQGWWLDDISTQLETIAGALGIGLDHVWDRVSKQMLRQARRWPYVQIVPAATWLAMQPGDWPVPSKVQTDARELLTEKMVPNVLSERMQALHLAGKQGAPTNQIMALAVRALAEGLGMQRIAFTLVQPVEQVLRTRYVHGVVANDGLRSLCINLEQPSLFSQLLQKPQSVWLNIDSRKRFANHLPETFLACAADNCFLMSIFVGSKPLGLIYADRHGQQEPGDDHYNHFKQICMLTSRALTHYSQR